MTKKQDALVNWKKEKDRANIVILFSECSSLVMGLVNWLEKHGMMVLVSKQYFQSKELSGHKEFKKLTA